MIAGHFKMRRSAGQAEHESTPHPRIELERPPACKCPPRRPAVSPPGMLENAMIEFDVNESYPMVLSLWHEELRKDVIVRTAALEYH